MIMMKHKMIRRTYNSAHHIGAIAISALLLVTIPVTSVFAYTDVPVNGANKLIDIFPGTGTETQLAYDVSMQIGAGGNVNYIPTQTQLNTVTTISLPMSGIGSILGVQHCPNLNYLYLKYCDITDDQADVIATLTNLRNLDLQANLVTSKVIDYIQNLNLIKLWLSYNTGVTSDGLEKLPASPMCIRL